MNRSPLPGAERRVKVCSECGRENGAEMRFCPACGQNLQSELQQFLRKAGLEPLLAILEQNDFSAPEELLSLDVDDFKELGISVGHKIRLKRALDELFSDDEDDPEHAEDGDEEEDGDEDVEEIEDDKRYEDEEDDEHGNEKGAEPVLLEHLSRLASVDRVYVAPDIPREKLAAASASYIRMPGVEVILLYDVTLFQGARQGLVIARDGVYLRDAFEPPRFFPFDSIVSVRADGDAKLFINEEQVMDCIGIASISVKRIASTIGILSDLEV